LDCLPESFCQFPVGFLVFLGHFLGFLVLSPAFPQVFSHFLALRDDFLRLPLDFPKMRDDFLRLPLDFPKMAPPAASPPVTSSLKELPSGN
jgi:hypothetical protein